MTRLTVTGVAEDHGSIVEFRAEDEGGRTYLVAADHRPAGDIVAALERGEEPQVDPPSWAVREVTT